MKRRLLLVLAGVALLAGGLGLQAQVGSIEGPRLFAQVLRFIEQHAVDSLSSDEIYEKAARGLVKNLNDPYADLYSPEQLASFQRNTLGNNYGGIGMQIESQDGQITVTRVFPGTPGERGGMQAGDRILMVDTTAVTGMRLDEVSGRLTGVAGTTVGITWGREGVPEPLRGTFTRAVIQVPAVPYTMILDGGYGYLPLQRFNESAGEQVERGIRELQRRGAQGLIIDLRGNPGGSLEQALEIGNLFLQPGVEIASVRHRGQQPQIYRATRRSVIDSMAVVVLIDNYSASASEIVAGTLQDHDRALVVGTSSFGKGLVQTLYPLEGGWAIKLTTGKWYTPSGRSIQGEHQQLEDGRFVEYVPDTTETDSTKRQRPEFRSTGGRVVYGGGGVTPDVLVKGDTLSGLEQELYRGLVSQWPIVYNTVYAYARELKPAVRADFTVSDAWMDELYQRLDGAQVEVDRARYDAGISLIQRMLEQRVAALAFGDSAAFRRAAPRDRQLQTAVDYLKRGRTQRGILALAAADAPDAPRN